MWCWEGNVKIEGEGWEGVRVGLRRMEERYNVGERIDVVCFMMKGGVKVKEVEGEIEDGMKGGD